MLNYEVSEKDTSSLKRIFKPTKKHFLDLKAN